MRPMSKGRFMKIAGSVALVTGANRGLGKALVEALQAGGARKVYAAARNISTLIANDVINPLAQ